MWNYMCIRWLINWLCNLNMLFWTTHYCSPPLWFQSTDFISITNYNKPTWRPWPDAPCYSLSVPREQIARFLCSLPTLCYMLATPVTSGFVCCFLMVGPSSIVWRHVCFASIPVLFLVRVVVSEFAVGLWLPHSSVYKRQLNWRSWSCVFISKCVLIWVVLSDIHTLETITVWRATEETLKAFNIRTRYAMT